jgi:hypothetical protein
MRLLLALPALIAATPALAQTPAAETEIRSVIADWYKELAKKQDGYPYRLTAPQFIDASPWYDHVDNGSRALGPRIYTSLAARAIEFRYDVDTLRIDPNFARASVWERGYFFAYAANKTYEMAHRTTFIFERGPSDGRWRIVAHESSSQGIPPNKITNPMPDLRARFYATEGKDRDPAEDARKAAQF